MAISITQPYFFPYLGLFQLIHATDHLIVFDTVKYQKRSWMNRNRILHPNKEFNYISVPVKRKPNNTPISDIEIVDGNEWKERILGQVSVYANKAPFYKDVCMLIKECFSFKEKHYASLCIHYMVKICEYLEINLKYDFLSLMKIEIPKANTPGEWSLNICKKMHINTYINMPSGYSIFDENIFKSNGIELIFLLPYMRKYKQFSDKFKSHMSIIDVLMWNPKNTVKEMIKNDYILLNKQDLLRMI